MRRQSQRSWCSANSTTIANSSRDSFQSRTSSALLLVEGHISSLSQVRLITFPLLMSLCFVGSPLFVFLFTARRSAPPSQTDEGTVFVYGKGQSGQLGLGPDIRKVNMMTPIATLEGKCITSISTGFAQSAAVSGSSLFFFFSLPLSSCCWWTVAK